MSKDTKKQNQTSDEQTESKKYRRLNIYFNSSNDDLYDHIQKQSDKTSYVMKLIREDLEESKASQQNLNDLISDVQELKSMMQHVLDKMDRVSIEEIKPSDLINEATSNPNPESEQESEPAPLKINSAFAGALLD